MAIKLDDASIYTDFQGLDALRQSAEKNSPEALKAVAKQFEALFLQQLLKGMRNAELAEGLMDSDAGDLYLDMYDKQISLNMAQGRGIGLADLLVDQLSDGAVATVLQGQSADFSNPDPLRTLQPAHFPVANSVTPQVPALNDGQQDHSIEAATSLPVVTAQSSTGYTQEHETPERFVVQYWGPAKQAAAELNVDVRVILAQTALETGWGKYVAQHADGRSSNNLFNIKADQRWQGESVSKPTIEFKDGIAQQEQARFRAYDSAAESFTDYVQFLQRSPRYTQALRQASNDSSAFVQGLQEAGYATDPDYANKVLRIADSELMNRALATLKISESRPLINLKG